MKYTQAVALLSAIVGLTSATPANKARGAEATLVFTGAAASYTVEVEANDRVFANGNSLSVDTVELEGATACELWGIDGATVTVEDGATATVGPPQTIVSGICW